MLQIWSEKQLFVCSFNWELQLDFWLAIRVEIVARKKVEVQIIDDAVGSHAVVANSQFRLVRYLEDLDH